MIVSALGTLLTRPRARARFGIRRDRPKAANPLSMATAAGVCGIALGAVLGYFLDPRSGRRRRHTARDRAMSRTRRGERRAALRARRAESRAIGIARRTVNAGRRRREPLDDVALAHKVESQLYRRTSAPKGQISINAEDGVVFLRGVMDRQDDIERIEAATRRITGVRSVENLIHMPGTPAPASRPKLERGHSRQASR
jgi:hypothetical protein